MRPRVKPWQSSPAGACVWRPTVTPARRSTPHWALPSRPELGPTDQARRYRLAAEPSDENARRLSRLAVVRHGYSAGWLMIDGVVERVNFHPATFQRAGATHR
ncbi:hypothetical protein Pen02_79620 [Plantactinospora endophytica]|uniref:Uncharacterized protein n=1 Tax=Plantactinospora endophytica TaxID=673535 RepID=A0ABQ4EE87_9ACTN|nr:hypothetical protein Pen02_79620 [Plantactinospora endophytica]